MEDNDVALTIQHNRETYIRTDGTAFTRADIFVKLSVTFRDKMLCRLKGPKLSVYLCIALHCGNGEMVAWPSIATIEHETGYGHTATIKAIQDLEEMGLIEVERRTRADGSADSNRYRVRGYATMGEGGPSCGLPLVHDADQGSSPSGHKEETREEEAKKEEAIEETAFPDVAPRSGKTNSKSKRITEYGDYLSMSAEVERRRNGIPDWAVPGPEGPHLAFQVVEAFCELTGQSVDTLTSKRGRGLLRHYARLSQEHDLTLEQMAQAHQVLRGEDWGAWYLQHHKWSTGFEEKYLDQMLLAARQIRDGQLGSNGDPTDEVPYTELTGLDMIRARKRQRQLAFTSDERMQSDNAD